MRWDHCADINVDEAAARAVTQMLEMYAAQPVLLLLSGGSWLTALDAVSGVDGRVTIAMLDERISTDPAVNNFAQLQRTTFYAPAHAAGAAFIDSRPGAEDTPTTVAARLDTAWKAWRTDHPDGVILATLGMGEDGHTAGILPGAWPGVTDSSAWVAGYTVPPTVNPFTERVTATPYFLQTHLVGAVALVSGAAKAAPLSDLATRAHSVLEQPAQLWHDISNLVVVTDQAIAGA